MFEITDKFRIRLGGNYYTNCKDLVVYKNHSLFTVKRHEDGYLGIDCDIYDAKGEKVATVRRNQVYPIKGRAEDYIETGSMDEYTLTEKTTGCLICSIKKRTAAHPSELDVAVHLYTPDGFLLDATPDRTNLGGAVIKDCTFENCGIGIGIGDRGSMLGIGIG
jgi:hypothetical protein